ncbi:site-specific integrase [Hymenobacter defluvii]|uniref:Tyrosine-type recombinase/integrase n=1 Tax=Hymenobacter defluvii TaxID=2054411 RepID=A0ABS3TI87_9BACT|nr:site-specific integrase [Hymenobacter defluvii]MBO3273381.1 tyrosine-type recombinase/integrase [Hymenobacter defluvii]
MLPDQQSQPQGLVIHRQLHDYAEEGARYFSRAEHGADNTKEAYSGNWKRFLHWCQECDLVPLPAATQTVAGFLIHLARNKKVSTIKQHLAAISKAHNLAGHPAPGEDKKIKKLIEGISKEKGVRVKQAPAFSLDHLKRAIYAIDLNQPAGVRDRALLLLGFVGAFRRQELTSLNVEDLQVEEDHIIVHLARSKTNQQGEAEEKAVFFYPDRRTCPVRALKDWLQLLHEQGYTSGPLFRSFYKGQRLSNRRLTPIRLNLLVQLHLGKKYSAHSLRASFVTISKLNGADDSEVMNQTKHKTSAMIRRYTRLDNVLQHNSAKKLGL